MKYEACKKELRSWSSYPVRDWSYPPIPVPNTYVQLVSSTISRLDAQHYPINTSNKSTLINSYNLSYSPPLLCFTLQSSATMPYSLPCISLETIPHSIQFHTTLQSTQQTNGIIFVPSRIHIRPTLREIQAHLRRIKSHFLPLIVLGDACAG